MKVAPMEEEIIDLRRKIHIMNAEAFLRTRKEHTNLVNDVINKMSEITSVEQKERIESIRRKGAYYSVRGERNFVRYTKNLTELNNALRRILASLQTNN